VCVDAVCAGDVGRGRGRRAAGDTQLGRHSRKRRVECDWKLQLDPNFPALLVTPQMLLTLRLLCPLLCLLLCTSC